MTLLTKTYMLYVPLILSVLVLSALQPAAAVSGQASTSYTPSVYRNGVIVDNGIIAVGLNDYGALGVDDPSTGIVGYQYPIGYSYEALAVGWWGDGWSVFYGNYSAGFAPSDDAWGAIAGVAPTVSTGAGPYGVFFTSIVETVDGIVRVNVTFVIPDGTEYIVKIFTVENTGNETLTDVEVKNIVDWDVWQPLLGDFGNYWGLDSIRRPDLNLAVAFVNETIAPGTVYAGFSAAEPPDAVDLNWDDYKERGISSPVVIVIQADGTTSGYFDGAVVYDWLLGDLAPGEKAVLHLVYASGDTLEELESNVEEAYSLLGIRLASHAPIGGLLDQSAGDRTDTMPWIIGLAAAILAALLAWKLAIGRR